MSYLKRIAWAVFIIASGGILSWAPWLWLLLSERGVDTRWRAGMLALTTTAATLTLVWPTLHLATPHRQIAALATLMHISAATIATWAAYTPSPKGTLDYGNIPGPRWPQR